MVTGNGKATSFWHDRWCGQVSLADKFPQLYAISEEQECSVAIMTQKNWRLTFRRWLHEELQSQLRRLQDIVHRFNVNQVKDRASWDW